MLIPAQCRSVIPFDADHRVQSMPITLAALDGGVEVELGEAFEAQVAASFPFGLLAFEEQGQAVVEGEFADVRMASCSSKA